MIILEMLRDYEEIQENIIDLKNNLCRTRKELDRWINGDLSKIRLEKESRANKIEKIILALESEIEINKRQLLDIEQEISKLEGIENKIIRYRYIEGNSLKEIAIKTGYDYGYIRIKHAEIKCKMKKLITLKNTPPYQ